MTEVKFLTFIRREKLANDTWSFFFSKANNLLPHFPGQYIDLSLSLQDKKIVSRSFTISSSPLEKYISITTRYGGSDFKHALFALKEKAKISITGPKGGFFLRENDKRPRVFLAGGIGITPFRAMMIYASQKNLSIPMTLLASFTSLEDVCFYQELTHLEKGHPLLKSIFTISTSYTHDLWQGEKGRISKSMLSKYIHFPNALYSIVGSQGTTESMVKLLRSMKIPNENIQTETFTGY